VSTTRDPFADRDDLQATQRYYDDFAQGYEAERHHGYHQLIDELESDLICRYAAGRDALEVGCGTGLILERVQRVARRAAGIDLSPGMLELARRRGLDVQAASATELPFADGSFDVAYSVKVLAHIQDIRTALAEMARVVRPGGHVIAEFYNPDSLRGLVKRLKRPTPISATKTDDQVYTRYDRLSDVRSYLPPSVDIVQLRGVRVVTPVSHVHRVPLLSDAVRWLEWRAADAPLIRRLGGFLLVVAQKH
jgi:ubiquinone/menaquinone biosynthesis C-methylase UbiE